MDRETIAWFRAQAGEDGETGGTQWLELVAQTHGNHALAPGGEKLLRRLRVIDSSWSTALMEFPGAPQAAHNGAGKAQEVDFPRLQPPIPPQASSSVNGVGKLDHRGGGIVHH